MPKYNSHYIERNVYLRPKSGSDPKDHHYEEYERPVIVCFCGSTRFMGEFYDANMRETLAGKIVLTVGMSSKGGCRPTDDQKVALDELHKRKIDLADEVLVLNVGGYIGDSTTSEIRYAMARGKPVRWLEPDNIPGVFKTGNGD